MLITREQLQRFCPAAVTLATELNAAAHRFGIDQPLELAHWLAQCAHESGGFTRLVENLNYSGEGLRSTWPKRFPGQTADAYARQPERIANRVYADRLGNGPEASGDGWRYRGRGIIQLTGRDNYARTSRALYSDDRLVERPELLQEPGPAALSAGFYWQSRDIGRLALLDDVTAVTRAVNGGTHGLLDRERWLKLARAVLA